MIAWALVVIGGLNWGLIGIGLLMKQNWDLVNILIGTKWPTAGSIIYILVGVATIAVIIGCKCSKCKACMVAK
jgi:uncharacterized membrane protein YuzA (DUF378 family)